MTLTPGEMKLRAWREDPVLFVKENFDAVPDEWQRQALMAFAREDKGAQRIALKACAGPGKSTAMVWMGWNFISCYASAGDHPKAAAMSVTADNLKDNMWSEFSKWQGKSQYLLNHFTHTSERIFCNQHPKTWFIAARSFPKTANADEQGRTLSGLHSKFILYLIDESGDISPNVLKAAEQGLSTGPAFGKIVQSGNPTSHTGMLHDACTAQRDKWVVITITGDPDDPNRSPRIDIEWARDQIRIHGRDNPWVMAYILGLFPPGGLNTLLGPDDVEAAMNRHLDSSLYSHAQKRIGVDVARFGDDETCLFPRQGMAAFKPVIMKGARTNDIAARVMKGKRDWGSEMEFVDGTGGWGAGVIDSMIQARVNPLEVNFSGKAIDPRYTNKRAEMWFLMADWIKKRGSLPKDPRLAKELVSPTYSLQNGKFLLESKEQIKKRLGFSPDRADALCFVSSTKIKTPLGDKPISSISVGDKVCTPMGDKTVMRLWESEVSRLSCAIFSDGRLLSGRGEHEIFTWNRGFVRLDALAMIDVFETANIWSLLLWSTLRKFFTTTSRFTFKQQADIILREGPIKRRKFFTGEFGQIRLARYLRNTAFTIKTMIGQTIELITLSLCHQPTMEGSTGLIIMQIQNLRNGWMMDSTWRERLRRNGIPAQTVKSGTQFTAQKHGMVEHRQNQNARSALGSFGVGFSNARYFAQSVAKLNFTTKVKGLIQSALNVAKNLIITSIGNRNIVLTSVVTETVEPTKVYNLTLDECNVYYANGILVANCLTFALPEMPARTTLIDGNVINIARHTNIHQAEYDPFKD